MSVESNALSCKKVDLGIDCTQVASLEGSKLEFPSDSTGTHVSSESPRRVSSPSHSDLSSTMQSTSYHLIWCQSREAPHCKKVDLGIDCTQVASLEGSKLEFPSDSNGTHVSSEGPRRVSFPSHSDLPSTMQPTKGATQKRRSPLWC